MTVNEESWEYLDRWLEEDPEINTFEVGKGSTGRGYCVRLMQVTHVDDDNPRGERCIADAESATFEGAVAGAMLLAREFKEGM